MTQEEALSILKLGVNVFLTGEPGSGKTHTINRYIAWLRERAVEPAVTASTGIASTHVHGMTIHSWSGIGVKKRLSDWDVEMIASREKTAYRIMNAKILIIDEISMLDAATLDSVDKVLRTLRHKVMREEDPFGGLQVVFVGDFFQLPPVSRSERASFAFESEAWREVNPVTCYLSEQHRQDDPEFLDLLGAVRKNTVREKHKNLIRSRIRSSEHTATRLHTHNADADRVNEESLAKIQKPTKVFHMTSRGARNLVEVLKEDCLSPETLTLKEGASVMFTRNNFEEGYVNGTLGIVTGFANSGCPIVKTKSGRTIEVEPAEWTIQDGNKILARILQVPIRLAWAITIHKSQGMSLDSATIDLSAAFEFGQGYVALSRVRSLQGLFLEGFNDRALMLHPSIVEQDRIFRAKSDAALKRITTIPREEREKLEQNFLRAIGAKEPRGRAELNIRQDSQQEIKSSQSRLRERYPNIGKPWTRDDDERLTNMFNNKIANKEIARHFGRKPSAIRARLGHLGLIQTYWKKSRP